MDYLNVTDSNQPYPAILEGCPGIECLLDTFTTIYKPRFPASVDVECSKQEPPTPPSMLILFIIPTNLFLKGGGGNTGMTVILIIVGIALGLIILAVFGWLYVRRTERDPPLLGSDAYTAVA